MHKIVYQKGTVVRVGGLGSPVIEHTHLKIRKGTSPVVEESFGMQNICIHTTIFELCMMEKKEEEERKKER